MKLFSVLSAAACLTSLVAAQVTVFSEDFSDNSAGWTMDPGWQIGAAAASSGHNYGGPDPASDADGTLGGGVAGVYLGGNSTGAAHSHRYFVSPTIPVGSLASAQLTFKRWLNSDYAPFMTNWVQAFNGVNWITIWQSGGAPGVQDASWTTQTYDVTPYLNPQFKIQFVYIRGSGAWNVSSWNIDNVQIVGTPKNFLVERFDDNRNGWTLGTEWQIGAATASSGETYGNPDPDTDGSGTFAGGLAGVVIGGNATTAIHGHYYLESPVVDISAVTSPRLEYQRWLNSDYTPYMINRVDVWNGTAWVNKFITGASPGVQDNAWTFQSFDVTAQANAGFKVRFGVKVDNVNAYTVSSWNLDDVTIGQPSVVAYTGAPCGAPAPLLYSAPPAIGTVWNATVFGGAPLTPGFLIFGTPTTPIGIVGSFCTLDLAPSFMIFMATDAAGAFTFPAAIPNDNVLLGLSVWAQAILIGPGGVSTTNVAGMTFGQF
jgi:hypothetical protein